MKGTTTWIEPISCKDLYEKKGELSPQLQDEFFSDDAFDWVCPNTDSIILEQDPLNYGLGTSFTAVVNSCDVATQANDSDFYSDYQCIE